MEPEFASDDFIVFLSGWWLLTTGENHKLETFHPPGFPG